MSGAGLYSFKTSVRHFTFLDLAFENELSVVPAFEIGAATKTSLATLRDLASAKSRLSLQIQASYHKGTPCARHNAPLPSFALSSPLPLSHRLLSLGERMVRRRQQL